MKLTTNLLLILLNLVFPAYAHEEPKPILPPVSTSSNDNHNNDSDNLKHAAEVILLGIGAYLIFHPKGTNDVKEGREEIKFRVGTHEPEK